VLDTGAVLHFASDLRTFDDWWRYLRSSYDQPLVLVPAPVLTECITGSPRSDVGVNRLLGRIENPQTPERHLLTPSNLTFARAGVLRTLAIAARPTDSKHVVSSIDALVVALAEERSAHTPVVVTTSDPNDIQLLVDLSDARNVGVWSI
jgi:hypothetical protein